MQRMDHIAKEYDGIWSINDDKITEFQQLIDIANKEEEYYDDVVNKTK